MITRAALCVVAIGLAVACSNRARTPEGQGRTKETAMDASGSVFDLIPRLVEKLPFRQVDVASLTGVTLTRDEAASNYAYDVFKGSGAKGGISSVEVRQRVQPSAGKNGIVLLDLAGGPCITQKEAMARYGEPNDLSIPTPHEPEDSPTYIVYKQKWGELRLGFTRAEPECLVSVVLDATS
jgi:hypothetical protein